MARKRLGAAARNPNDLMTLAEVRELVQAYASLPVMLLDLDANAISGATGASVASLPDISGNGLDFIQDVPEARPTLVENAVNGRKAVRLNQRFLYKGYTGITGISDMTLFMVMAKHSTTVVRSGVLSASGNGPDDYNTNNGNFAIGMSQTDNETGFRSLTSSGSLTATNDVAIGDPNVPSGTFALVSILAGRGQPFRFFVNGSEKASAAGGYAGALGLNRLYLGSRYYNDAPTDRSDMSIARLCMYGGRFTATQLSEKHNELGTRYGLPVT